MYLFVVYVCGKLISPAFGNTLLSAVLLTNLNKMTELLEKSGFTKVDGLDRWFTNFQGRTYYLFMDGGKWWVLINKSGTDIKVNQTGFTTFEHIRDFFNAVTLGGIVL